MWARAALHSPFPAFCGLCCFYSSNISQIYDCDLVTNATHFCSRICQLIKIKLFYFSLLLYCFCHSKIKVISSCRHVISSISGVYKNVEADIGCTPVPFSDNLRSGRILAPLIFTLTGSLADRRLVSDRRENGDSHVRKHICYGVTVSN